jgi:cytochrome c oxidase subunit 2
VIRPGVYITSMAALAAALGLPACAGTQSALNPAGPHAAAIASLTWLFFAVCAVVYVLVLGATAWAVVRRRRPSDDEPWMTGRVIRTIVGAVAVTIGVLVALLVADAFTSRRINVTDRPDTITIEAIGNQWWWNFRYKGQRADEWVSSPNELHVPTGVPVIIEASSRDVIHSFWVPNLLGKRDLVPGMKTRTWLQADRPGIYRGQCAEFCGHQHANMAFLVVAEPMDQYQAWLQQQRRSAPEPATDDARRGRDLFLGGTCAMCHTIRGTRAGSHLGPDLTHLAGRRTIGAGTLPMTADHLRSWIADSQAIKPGNRMPPNPLAADDLRALLAYLGTLK